MTTDYPGRRRAPLCAAGPIAGIAAALCLIAGAALAVETAPRAPRELVPTGPGGTIELSPPSTAEETVSSLALEKGKSAIVRTAYGVTRVSVGDPKIADVIVLHTQEIQIVAKEVGSTNVVLWGGGGGIQAAINVNVGAAYSSIESAIRRVVPVGDVHVENAGNSILLMGSLPDAASLEHVLSLAKALTEKEDCKLVNMLTVGGNQQVMIEVTVSEINRTKGRAIETNFAAQIIRNGDQEFFFMNRINSLSAPVLGEDNQIEFFEFADQVNLLGHAFPIGTGFYNLFVRALDEKGVGKILATPTLVARTGETAKFLSGGEIPYPVQAGLGTTSTEFKPFGVGVSFTPTVLSDDRIHLEVNTEVSAPDFSFTVLGVPLFNTRRASTGIDVGDGQTFAMAGLLRDELTERVSMYPLLGQIPIIGVLFRSSTFEKQSTELVLIVRPRLVKPLDPAALPPLPTDYFDEPNWFEFYLMGRAEGFDNRVAAAEPQAGFVGDAGYRLPASPEEDGDEGEAK